MSFVFELHFKMLLTRCLTTVTLKFRSR